MLRGIQIRFFGRERAQRGKPQPKSRVESRRSRAGSGKPARGKILAELCDSDVLQCRATKRNRIRNGQQVTLIDADQEVLVSVAARKRKTRKTFGNGRLATGGEDRIMGRWRNSTMGGRWLKSTRKLENGHHYGLTPSTTPNAALLLPDPLNGKVFYHGFHGFSRMGNPSLIIIRAIRCARPSLVDRAN